MITASQLDTIVRDVVDNALGRNVHAHARRALASDLVSALVDALPDIVDDDVPDEDEPDDEPDPDDTAPIGPVA